MSAYRLDTLFRPRSVAIIGASNRPHSIGEILARNVIEGGYEGRLVLVNPAHREIMGHPCLRSVDEIHDGVDLALIATPWSTIPGLIERLAERGCKGAVVYSLASDAHWFWASQPRELQRLRDLAYRLGVRLIGPASQGLILPRARLYAGVGIARPRAGSVALVSQSGAMLNSVAEWASHNQVGLSTAIALGDALDVDTADCLDQLAQDTSTRAVLIYIEELRAARKFVSAARECSFRKPLFALRPRHQPGSSSTWLSDEEDGAYSALLYRSGVLRVRGLSDLFAASDPAFASWNTEGRRLAVVANGRSLGLISADLICQHGGELAELSEPTQAALARLLPPGSDLHNPIDLQRDADPQRFASACAVLGAATEVDAIVLAHHATAFSSAAETAQSVAAGAPARARIVSVWAGSNLWDVRDALGDSGIPCFATPEAAMAAHSLYCRYREHRRALQATPPPHPALIAPDRNRADRLFASLAQAPGRKVLGDLLRHYAVRLNWRKPQAGSRWQIALRRHVRLGCVIELRGRTTGYELPPLNALRAQALAQRCGADENDARGLIGTLIAFGQIGGQAWPIERLALNDVQVTGDRLNVGSFDFAAATTALETSIRACPEDMDEAIQVAGRRMLISPIRAEDEPALREGFTRLSPEEVRLRFLYPLKALTHELAAKLSQIDYSREMALILTEPGAPGMRPVHAVVRACYTPADGRAEFAIVVPRALSGQGLGSHLMERIIEWCRGIGAREVWGEVLAENSAMLALASKLGFSLQRAEDNLVHVRLPL